MKTTCIFLLFLLLAEAASAQNKPQPKGCTIILSADTVEIQQADWVFSLDVFAARSHKTKRYGYMDSGARWLLPPDYDSLKAYYIFLQDEQYTPFSEAQKGGKWGFLQGATKEVTPFIYEAVEAHGIGPFFLFAKYEGKWGVLDAEQPTEWQILPQFDTLLSDYGMQEGHFAAQKAGKWGIIDGEGKEVLPLRFERLERINEALFQACEGDSCYLLGENWQRLCACQYEILPALGQTVEPPYAYERGGYYGLIGANCQPITELVFLNKPSFSEGIAQAQDGKTELWGYINEKGEWLVNPKFRELKASAGFKIKNRQVDIASRKGSTKYGLVDREGKWLLRPRWFEAPYIGWSDQIIPVKVSPRRYKYVNTQTFSPVFKGRYAEAGFFHLTTALVKKEEKWGIIDKKGKWLVPAQFEKRPSIDEENRIMTIFWEGKWHLAKF